MRALALVSTLLGALLLGPPIGSTAPTDDTGAILDAFEAAWRARDVEGYLSLWDFASPELREQEAEFARDVFASPAIEVALNRPMGLPPDADQARFNAQIVFTSGRTGRVELWSMSMRRGPRGWALTARTFSGRIEGLVHLSLDAGGFRADGLTLKAEDFELRMNRGTLFTSPSELGPTAMVFVGDGVIHVRPGPETEREQLRQYCGNPELVQKVKLAYIRMDPDDIETALVPNRFQPDPEAAERFPAAVRYFREQSVKSFVLDGLLPGSPWWVVPTSGDVLVNFDAGSRGTLTFAISHALPEAVNLFNKAKRLQLCLYPSAGRTLRYSEDQGKDADVLHHDLTVRFDPREGVLRAIDTLRLRLLTAAGTLKLRLDDALGVESVSSKEAGSHLFFRVRGQDSLMVSLGPLAGIGNEVTLTVRFGGAFSPAPVETELLQAPPNPMGGLGTLSTAAPGLDPSKVDMEKIQVFSSRNAWYPQSGNDDYATARLRLRVPAGYLALAGGAPLSPRIEGDDVVSEYALERPAKYLSVVVGRLTAVADRREGEVSIEGFAVSRARPRVAQDLDRATDILRFFTDEFGPCPYTPIRLVEIEGATPGGHSPAGIVVLSRRPPVLATRLVDDPASFDDVPGFFLAHELAHQWWGQGVAPQNYRERWLAEGLAQHAAALWVQHSQGDGVFRELLKRLARWAVAKSPAGPISLGSRVGHVRSDAAAYRGVIYDKGAYVLHMLRRIVGEETFREALRGLQQEHRYGKVGTDDLREALESASGRNLSPYFQQWVFSTSLPRLRYSHRAVGSASEPRTEIDVRPENLPGPVPLELTVVHRTGREVIRVTLPPDGGRWTVATPSRVIRVEINTDRGLLVAP